jgi:pimeloyl-ACP methyl ester carboxylesterase
LSNIPHSLCNARTNADHSGPPCFQRHDLQIAAPRYAVAMQVNGVELHVEDSGGSGPPIVFSHGLLWSTRMWRFQVAALREKFRCIAYDHRGQGRSEITASGYDMDTLTDDAAALIEKLGVGPVHFVGLSMGGFVGMRLAARRPELVKTLALIETANDTEPWHNVPKYKAMALLSSVVGLKPFAPTVMKIMFAIPFQTDPKRQELRNTMKLEMLENRPVGLRRAVDGVIFRKPFTEGAKIKAPTTVISGELDSAVTPDRSRRLCDSIPGARFVSIPLAGHTSSIEEPAAVTAALLAHFGNV